jgi:hypothetical protein
MQKKIIVYASELSGVVGRNPFIDVASAIDKLVCRLEKRPDKEREYKESLSESNRKVLHYNTEALKTPTDVAQNLAVIKMHVDGLDVAENEKCKMLTLAEKIQNTEFGSRNEESIRTHVSLEKDLEIKKDDRFRCRPIHFLAENRSIIFVGGKCDGVAVIDGETVLVEIKNRVRRLFGNIPDYEKVQLMAYMYIFDYKKAVLIENYREQRNEIFMSFDPEYWSHISRDLHRNLKTHGVVE